MAAPVPKPSPSSTLYRPDLSHIQVEHNALYVRVLHPKQRLKKFGNTKPGLLLEPKKAGVYILAAQIGNKQNQILSGYAWVVQTNVSLTSG